MDRSSLFREGSMGKHRVKNRIFMAPLTRSRAENPEHAPEDIHAEYYAQRSSAGLIISEATVVSPRGVGFQNVPGIYTEAQTERWKKVTEAVHGKDGKIFMQLWHVGRLSHPDFLGGELPVSASAINPEMDIRTPGGRKPTVTPKELSIPEIERTIEDFALAGRNARKAGFDGVEIHSSNGYLFHQFFSNSSNKRADRYGGSPENNSRILFEVLDAMKAEIPEGDIGIRLNPMMRSMGGISVDETTTGIFEYIIKRLNTYSLAYLHLSRPLIATENEHAIDDVIGHFGKLYHGFVVANSNYDPDSAAKEVASGRADAIAFGRLFIPNPDLPERIRNHWDIAESDPSIYYGGGESGYTDFPFYDAKR